MIQCGENGRLAGWWFGRLPLAALKTLSWISHALVLYFGWNVRSVFPSFELQRSWNVWASYLGCLSLEINFGLEDLEGKLMSWWSFIHLASNILTNTFKWEPTVRRIEFILDFALGYGLKFVPILEQLINSSKMWIFTADIPTSTLMTLH